MYVRQDFASLQAPALTERGELLALCDLLLEEGLLRLGRQGRHLHLDLPDGFPDGLWS